jgi:hypothetical protein
MTSNPRDHEDLSVVHPVAKAVGVGLLLFLANLIIIGLINELGVGPPANGLLAITVIGVSVASYAYWLLIARQAPSVTVQFFNSGSDGNPRFDLRDAWPWPYHPEGKIDQVQAREGRSH